MISGRFFGKVSWSKVCLKCVKKPHSLLKCVYKTGGLMKSNVFDTFVKSLKHRGMQKLMWIIAKSSLKTLRKMCETVSSRAMDR